MESRSAARPAHSGPLPVWLLGLCNFPFGAFFALMLFTAPQLLMAEGIGEARIASMTAVGLTPTFFAFFLSPLLDWRFTRRRYAIGFGVLTAAALVAALLSIHDLVRLTVFMFVGSWAVSLYGAALGGWFATIVDAKDKGRLGAWLMVGNLGGGGLMAVFAVVVLRQLPFDAGVGLLAGALLAPLPFFAWMPVTAPDRRLATDTFREFFRDVLALLRTPTVWWTLFLFAIPAATFALTNLLSGLGRDFAASERMVGLVMGSGVTVAGVSGSLAMPRLIKGRSPRRLYVTVGAAGAAFTFGLAFLPHTPGTFVLAVLGENLFQAAAFAVSATIVLVTIGEKNPLAATQFALLYGAMNLPQSYMQALDGAAYGVRGLSGALVTDALVSLMACGVAAMLLRKIESHASVLSPIQVLSGS